MTTAAVILNWNGAALTAEAARSVRDQVDAVFIVDNCSAPADADAARRLAQEIGAEFLRLDANYGYAGGNNAGIAAALDAGHDAILVINNDVVVHAGAVAALAARLADRDDLAACAPLVVSHDTGAVLHSSCRLDLESGRFAWCETGSSAEAISPQPRPTDYVSGEAFLVRASVLRECGAFDERFGLTFEDGEWSVRVRRAGWALETCPSAVVAHHHSASMGGIGSAFYQSRNYPLFLYVAIGLAPPRALARGAAFAIGVALRRLEGRNWAALRGAVRGFATGVLMLGRAVAGAHGEPVVLRWLLAPRSRPS